MKYIITLEHGDFELLLESLRKAQANDVIEWDAVEMVCENTQVKY